MLLVGSTLAWRLADSVLSPVRRVTRTARSINETDLRQRIDVEGQDEVAELATTFNAMLDRLETSFATQRRFLDDAGHELRTPITIARGHLELLGRRPAGEGRDGRAGARRARRMGRMVERPAAAGQGRGAELPRARAGRRRRLTDELHAKTQALGDRVWAAREPGEGVVLADRQRLTQAVVQLAQNAVQHTRPGDEIALGSSLSTASCGCGCATAVRASPSRTRDASSSASSRARGDRHRDGRRPRPVHRAGHRRGARRPGRAAQPPRRRRAVHPRAARRRTRDRRGRAVTRILIVEDEPRISAFLQKGLPRHGFTTELAEDVAEGLARARTGPDLVVLDRGLPDGDGLECCTSCGARSGTCRSSC
jgi:HAMP domain-containing protein